MIICILSPAEDHYMFPQAQDVPTHVRANISKAEAEEMASNARYWMQMQNSGRTLGKSPIHFVCLLLFPQLFAFV